MEEPYDISFYTTRVRTNVIPIQIQDMKIQAEKTCLLLSVHIKWIFFVHRFLGCAFINASQLSKFSQAIVLFLKVEKHTKLP